MPEDVAFAFRQNTKETDAQKIGATGYATIDITLPYYPSSTIQRLIPGTGNDNAWPDCDWLPSKVTNYGTWSTIKTSAVAIKTTSMQLFPYLVEVKATLETWWMDMSVSVWPSMTDATCLFAKVLDDVKLGMLNQPPRHLQNDLSTAATTLAEIIDGFNWKDGGLNDDRHHLLLRRLAYFWALNYTHKMVPLAQNIVATNSMKDNFDKIVEVVTALILEEIYWFFMLMPLQSDRAGFNLAFMDYNLLKAKAIEEMVTAVDEDWYDWVKTGKVAYITAPSLHEVWTNEYINDNLVQATTLDNTFWKIENYNFKIPATSLMLARQLVGLGKYDDNKLFAFLPHTGYQSDDGTYDSHGEETWAIGVETALMLNMLDDARGKDRDMIKALNGNKHYTFIDLAPLISDYWTDFNIVKNLNGLAEPEVGWAMKRNFAFGDATMVLANEVEVARDPTGVLEDATNLISTDVGSVSAWAGIPIWPLVLLQEEIGEYYSLVVPAKVTERHMRFDLLMGLLWGVDDATGWQDYHYKYSVLKFVEFIDHKSKELLDWVWSDATTGENHLRWECVRDVCNSVLSIATQYNFTLVENGIIPLSKTFQAARPHGLEDAYDKLIDNFTHPDNLRHYARYLLEKSNVGAPQGEKVVQKEPSKAPSPKQPDTKVDAGSVDDEGEEE